MEVIRIKGHKVVGGKVEGEALKSTEAITFVGGINPYTGILTEKGHQLEGEKVEKKILVFPVGKGSTGGSYRIYDMAVRGTAPIGFVNQEADPITTIGAIMGEIPLIDKLEEGLDSIETGDYIVLNADEGYIEIHKKKNT